MVATEAINVPGVLMAPSMRATEVILFILREGDMVRALRQSDVAEMTVAEAGTAGPIVAFPEEPVHAALRKMLDRDIGRLPVVNRDDPARPIGYIGRAEILSVRRRPHEEENIRQRG